MRRDFISPGLTAFIKLPPQTSRMRIKAISSENALFAARSEMADNKAAIRFAIKNFPRPISIVIGIAFTKIPQTYTFGTIALYSFKTARIFPASISDGDFPSRAAKDAATAAACPIAMHDACTRKAEFASLSLETHLPATSILRAPFGTIAERPTHGTLPRSSILGFTVLCVCKSMG